GMKRIPDGSVDLIITSPPYNLGAKHHTGNKVFKAYSEYSDDMPESVYQEWQKNILNECFRVLKDNGSMWYNHKNRIKDGFQRSEEHTSELQSRFDLVCRLLLEKKNN